MGVSDPCSLIQYKILTFSVGLCELLSVKNVLYLSSTALVNYSKILALKYKTINRFEKYIYNDTKKI